MNAPLAGVAALLFGSGLCALVYQVVWLREFRLVFGASTAASAAVLAIFVAGLGAGGLLLGPRADRKRFPLLFYARLEAAIALSAALTPALLPLVRALYVALGGTPALGLAGGSLLRLLLSALVLALPTLLMGGTLPAAARAIRGERDTRRRGTAILYGVNTLGAVMGAFLSTFVLLEALGNRATLWLACALNLAIAAAARGLARRASEAPAEAAAAPAPEAPAPPPAPAAFTLAAAFLSGLVFFLMEIVWYRMLSPLLGGSVFSFGLILSVALFGIGLGGAFHAVFGEGRPATLRGFALTCLLEAACLSGAYALGDRVAVLALVLRPLGHYGFAGHVLAWTAVCAIVVLPAAFVAGVQFPLLIGLLGRGRDALGRQIGQAYAWNTAGAIAGSLAGGFGLLPLLGAPRAWLLAALLLLALGAAAALLSLPREGVSPALFAHVAAASLVAASLQATGPTAAWRHSGIGAGRANASYLSSPNGVVEFLHAERRLRHWETEGVESSVALMRRSGMAFAVNGKVDGHFTLDAPTQVMSGLLGAALHEAPRRALVIGLGTGSTAGWLGALPQLERVDVVELERATLEVARQAAAVNRDVLDNPRVRIAIGDAREVLLASRERYDVIFSEPSNPYRAGIASLFTEEFYRGVRARLADGGVFVQWMQAYDLSSASLRDIYATIGAVFPEVETWRTHRDLLLVGTLRPLRREAGALRLRLAGEPYLSGMLAAWRVRDLEGFLGYFVAAGTVSRELAAAPRAAVNSDDRNRLEFGFARALGRRALFETVELAALARERGADRPAPFAGEVDWARVADERRRLGGVLPAEWGAIQSDERARVTAYVSHQNGDRAAALAAWLSQPRPAQSPTELALVAEGLAAAGDEAALPHLARLRALQPAEADALLGELRLQQDRLEEAHAALAAALERHRSDPWPRPEVMSRALRHARDLAFREPRRAPRLYELLAQPFAAFALDEERRVAAFEIATGTGLVPQCAAATGAFEPWVVWRREFLQRRLVCYEAAGDPRAARATADLTAFASAEPEPLVPSSSGR